MCNRVCVCVCVWVCARTRTHLVQNGIGSICSLLFVNVICCQLYFKVNSFINYHIFQKNICCPPWATYWPQIGYAVQKKTNKKLDTVSVSALMELHKTCILVRGISKGIFLDARKQKYPNDGNQWSDEIAEWMAACLRGFDKEQLWWAADAPEAPPSWLYFRNWYPLCFSSVVLLSLCSTNFPPLLLILLTSVSVSYVYLYKRETQVS